MKTRKNFRRFVSCLALISAMLFILGARRPVEAYGSKAWRERVSERTVTLWVEGQPLVDGIVLNARGELNVTWLERGLNRILNTDEDAPGWVKDNLNHYFSNRRETRAKMRNRDVFVLSYRAIKNWSFDPAKLEINGYAVTRDDILTHRVYWESELTPGSDGMVAVAAPSLKPGETVELRYEDAAVQFEVPRPRAR